MGRHPGFGVVSPGYGYWDGLFGVAVFCTNLDKANEIISAEPNTGLVNSWDGVKGHAAGYDWNVGAVNVGLRKLGPIYNLMRRQITE